MQNFIQKIKNTPILGDYLTRIFHILLPYQTKGGLISKYIPSKQATIIQVGSNDGKTRDPLFLLINKNKNWKVIFVEPVPYLFERLKKNYGLNNRFIFENAAINEGTEQTFFSVKKEAKHHIPDLPVWYDQLGSFKRENITNHLDGILDKYIEEMKLKGVTLSYLLEKNSITSLDLLHIDTEGYDWKILSQLPLKEFKPIIILYEYKHLIKSEIDQSIEFLKHNYYIYIFGGDYLAIKKDIIKKSDLKKLKSRLVDTK